MNTPELWRAVRSALDSWPKTARLCFILLIIGILICVEIGMTTAMYQNLVHRI